eukprot:GHUV01033666.1.p2 GENE.GHUV01033666.1~~GHUV01033666.1.p2  ORF type:complete len:174 (+),score=48.89 GHUV01033666.1:213-734(+)
MSVCHVQPCSGNTTCSSLTIMILSHLNDALMQFLMFVSCAIMQSLDSDEDGEGDEGDGYQLIHGAAGLDPSELPGPVQPLLAALRHNQAQIEALQAEREQLRLKAKQQEEQLRKQLSQQRRWEGCAGCTAGLMRSLQPSARFSGGKNECNLAVVWPASLDGQHSYNWPCCYLC